MFLDLLHELKIGDPQKEEAEKGENKRVFTCVKTLCYSLN